MPRARACRVMGVSRGMGHLLGQHSMLGTLDPRQDGSLVPSYIWD